MIDASYKEWLEFYMAKQKAYGQRVREYGQLSFTATVDTPQDTEAVLKQFADMISPAVTKLPPTTKYQPKMTLAPFIAAYKAVYGDPDKGEA